MDNRKTKIESIYPLSFMQQGLLFHRISNSIDQGLLLVEAKLTGSIDLCLFENAWNEVVLRHQIMRSTVHWEKLDKPLQIVHQHKKVCFAYFDWQCKSKEKQREGWEVFAHEYLIKGVDLNKNPLLNVFLIQTEKEGYKLFWPVHHLLLDGWSSSIILNDVLINYEALRSKTPVVFEALPTHKSYLKWLSKKNPADAKHFWKSYFKDFKRPYFFCHKKGILNPNPHISKTSTLPFEITRGIHDYCRKTKITINTFLQGIWSLTLLRYFNTTDIVHGTTVSGRSSGFPNIHLLAGMYMNIQPFRGRIWSIEQTIPEWFKDLQKRQQDTSKYEYLGLDQLISYLEQPMNSKLFDSLFIYENYPVVESNDESIGISEFKSGLTSTFPVTMVAIPGDSIQLKLMVESELINNDSADWLMNSYNIILENIINRKLNSCGMLSSLIVDFKKLERFESRKSESIKAKYLPPRNELETQLTTLWEDEFGLKKIGVNDNFFDLGGDSLSAVQIISKANKLGIKIAPNQLFKHQSIAELSNALIASEKPQDKYNHLVEIKSTGNKMPLYCLHAGGIHVFSYNRLEDYLDLERPIYALQSSPLNEKLKFHRSIEEMANDFVDEIQEIQPKGPYHIMAYCFSTAVGLEVASLLYEKGEQINFLVVDTIADYQNVFASPITKIRVLNVMKALGNNPFKTLYTLVNNRFVKFVKPKLIRYGGKSEESKVERLRFNYMNLYKAYKWRPFEGIISLILTHKTETNINSDLISSWRPISQDKLKIIYMDGEHLTLFAEPDVKKMANVLDKCMTSFEISIKK